jgi:hypothetical protein
VPKSQAGESLALKNSERRVSKLKSSLLAKPTGPDGATPIYSTGTSVDCPPEPAMPNSIIEGHLVLDSATRIGVKTDLIHVSNEFGAF